MTDPAASTQALVGRQPIFDRRLEVYAYELLFRPGPQEDRSLVDDNQATARVIVDAVLSFGLERLAGPHRVFINVNADFLLDERPLPLPPERVVLEVLETVRVDDSVIDAVRALRARGFGIALDDFVYEASWEPLLEAAHFVKVDVRALDAPAVEALFQRLQGRGLRLLAEKVETEEEFERLRDLGFEYFQGYFLERPLVVTGQRVASSRLPVLRLLAVLQDPEVDVREVERAVAQDVRLSYKLLQSINSAMFGLPRAVESLREAVVHLGLNTVSRWASLIALAGFDDRPSELIVTSLVRARLCELLARAAREPSPHAYFSTGLLSTLDALMRSDMETVLASLPLADDVRRALLAREGRLGEALRCAVACEQLDQDAIAFAGLPFATISAAYADALVWSLEAVRATGPHGEPARPARAHRARA
jgi:EAL and modified HD-GYP domain-containing signal transduction protein